MTEIRIRGLTASGWCEPCLVEPHRLADLRTNYNLLWAELPPTDLERLNQFCSIDPEILRKSRPRISLHSSQWLLRLSVPQHRGQRLILKNILLVLDEGLMISFEEGHPLKLDPEWLTDAQERILATRGTALLQKLVRLALEHYFRALGEVETRLHRAQEEIMANPQRRHLSQAHHLKRELLHLQRAVAPLPGQVSACLGQTLRAEQHHFLLDLNENCLEILDFIETYQGMARGLTELFVGSLTRRQLPP